MVFVCVVGCGIAEGAAELLMGCGVDVAWDVLAPTGEQQMVDDSENLIVLDRSTISNT